MQALIITCHTLKTQIDKVISETGCPYTVLTLELALHNEPEKLRKVLQETLDRISNVDQVLLVMGFCGNAVVGLKPDGFRLVLPKADDCITMLLGSQNKRTEIQRNMPTLFFSRGWLDCWDQIEKIVLGDYERTLKRYGKEKADKILQLTFKHYKRIGLIDTGDFDLEKYFEMAKKYADLLKLKCEVIPGTMSYLEKFITGPWGKDFIIINSGETVILEHLYGKDEVLSVIEDNMQ